MKSDMRRLIRAALAYAEVAEAHADHEARAVRTLREAAALSRDGDIAGARRKKAEVDLRCYAFDYGDVHAELIEAVKPFRKKKRRQTGS